MKLIPDIKIAANGQQQRNTLVVHGRMVMGPFGSLFTELLKISVHSAIDDGETSTGSQKMRVMTPTEIVARCVELTERAHGAMEQRGWIIEAPSLDDIESADTDQRKPGF